MVTKKTVTPAECSQPARVGRREFLKAAGRIGLVGAGLLHLPGCGFYRAETGAAFEPWNFPGTEAVPERIVARAALLAASPHNTQPWGLGIAPDAVDLRARPERHLGAMDSLRRELHIGLGCALENMLVAARSVGRSPEALLFPDPADEALVARVTLAVAQVEPDPSFAVIAQRHTNRGAYSDVDPPAGLEDALRSLVDDPAVSLHWIGTRADRERLGAETIAATEAIIADAEMSQDSARWYRHSYEDITRHRDGVTIDATGNGAAVRALGKILAQPDTPTMDAYWLAATKARQVTGSAFVVLSSASSNTRKDQVITGRIYQRMHLWATRRGLAMQPLNQLPERQDREETARLEPRFTNVLTSVVGAQRRAQMLFRIGQACDEGFESPRRPLEWVLS